MVCVKEILDFETKYSNRLYDQPFAHCSTSNSVPIMASVENYFRVLKLLLVFLKSFAFLLKQIYLYESHGVIDDRQNGGCINQRNNVLLQLSLLLYHSVKIPFNYNLE